ncbi:MAG TPA: DUF1279 domain-containing protein [Gemmatimonadaceae bacterium]
MRKTLKHVLTEYGTVALVLYLVIFTLVLLGSWIAIRAGWSPTSVGGKAGTFAAAYIITKITQPLRIGATVVLTPIMARLWERMTSRGVAREAPPEAASAAREAGSGKREAGGQSES